MRSILLVEDEDPKRRHIGDFLRQTVGAVVVEEARSVTSAIARLETTEFSLVILDMSLPTFDQSDIEPGGRPQGFGGTEVIRHVALSEMVCPIVVVTGYEVFPKGEGAQMNIDDLVQQLTSEFPSLVRGVLHYSSALEEWKVKLADLIMEIGGLK
jgi:CheY-like chemotaxis protein